MSEPTFEQQVGVRPVDHAGGDAGHGPVDPGEALDRLREAVELVAAADLDGLSDRELLEHTVALDVQVSRLEAQRLGRLAAVHRRDAFTEDGL